MKKFNNKSKLLVSVLCAVLLTMFTFNLAFAKESEKNEQAAEIPAEARLLIQLKELLKNNHVNDVKDIQLLRGAIKGMVDSLEDPYSEFFTPKDFKDFGEATSGNFGGIGVVIITKDNYVTIVSVLEKSPGEKAGLKAGDKIVEVDGKDITGFTANDAAEFLRGEKGTKVALGIIREGEKQILRFTIERDIIKINPIEYKILEDGIGYIKISEFNQNTVENLDKCLANFKENNVSGIILDLRNNPGGLLNQAVEVSSRFVPEGPIVHVVSKEGTLKTYKSENNPDPYKMAVLVNGGSASASEIVAGAIRDRQVGKIVGEKTFGKATVQQTIDLGPIGGIKLTIARYTTPNGFDINEVGLKPDVIVEDNKANPVKDFVALKGERNIKYKDVGIDVLGIQQRLKLLNLYNAGLDGIFGKGTLNAVKAFQRSKGLPVTGVVDKNFCKVLDEAVSEYLKNSEDIQLKKAIEVLKQQLNANKKAA